MVEIVSKVLTTTSSKHTRINVLQSMVDIMCMLVLWGTVWQVQMFATTFGGKVHRDSFLNGLQNLLEIVPLLVTARFVHETFGTF